MSRIHLGDQFDIHTGGVDHIPIHHENEIAQSEGLTGKNPAKFWIHGDFMLVDGGKMSKSLGNTYTIDQLIEKGYSPMVFRFFCLNAHYRKKLNFTFDTMDAAKISYERLCASLLKHKNSTAKTDESVIANYKKQFEEAVFDDLNVPQALGVLFTMLKEPSSIDIYNLALDFDRVFGLDFDKIKEEKGSDIPAEIIEMAEKMQSARLEKNWPVADALRTEIGNLGYLVKNTKEGYEIVKK
jgi:cysteinyl-tRNA synthetase